MRIKSAFTTNIFLFFLLTACLYSSCTPPQAQRLTPRDLSIERPGATALVVVQSRTGNTALLGMHISETMAADYIRLETPPGYGDTYIAYTSRKKEVPIRPEKKDLSKYRLVFLGSPIWYWHPTAFIYTFIKNNDLSGKKVVLFFTNQGGLGDDAIDEWKALVRKQGGTVIDVLGINRNEFETYKALLAEIKAQVGKHKPGWDIKDR